MSEKSEFWNSKNGRSAKRETSWIQIELPAEFRRETTAKSREAAFLECRSRHSDSVGIRLANSG
ncbi:hypothetical protein, partial [Streptomyces sp. NPDC058677]|uniref:hypothetical protein n=1 Tax=Streptomyces sp. NPDC058677 TaxID=3346594 RepID=UPI00364A74E1